jgi:hypothetical protein
MLFSFHVVCMPLLGITFKERLICTIISFIEVTLAIDEPFSKAVFENPGISSLAIVESLKHSQIILLFRLCSLVFNCHSCESLLKNFCRQIEVFSIVHRWIVLSENLSIDLVDSCVHFSRFIHPCEMNAKDGLFAVKILFVCGRSR